MLRKILQFKLRLAARLILWRHEPVVIGVTGSVGKTGTKAAIARVLATRHSVRMSQGSYNNEFGLPLTIIGVLAPGKSIFKWLWVAVKFFLTFFSRNYPDVLVLEMGADRRGDIAYLAGIAQPAIAVVTRVGTAHLEFFSSPEELQREKAQLVASLPPGGVAVLNVDDPKVAAMRSLHEGKTVTYGLGVRADVRASELQIRQYAGANAYDPAETLGMKFEISHNKGESPVMVSDLLGRPAVYALLAAFAVGRIFGLAPKDIVHVLGKIQPQPGRPNPLLGIKNTILLDDTYNASPEAAEEAIRVLRDVKGRRRIAVLGDMLELGERTEDHHRKIGRLLVDQRIDLVFAVGARAAFIADEAEQRGLVRSRIREYPTADSARLPLQRLMKEGDVVLIKGSQAMRMEKIVREVMAEPERAGELLCRQDESWLRK